LPPMSQYDQAATPMWASLQKKPDVRPYRIREARIPLDEKNSPRAYGWKRSLELALEEADDADDDDMNDLIWKSVKGAASPRAAPAGSCVCGAATRPVIALRCSTGGDPRRDALPRGHGQCAGIDARLRSASPTGASPLAPAPGTAAPCRDAHRWYG